MSVIMALLTAFLLGVIHGITPDEHTWPITFSYSIGSFSARQGMKVGFTFSLAFAVQRAIMSELSYLLLDKIFRQPSIEYIVYVIVGAAMIYGGFYIFNFRTHFHWHWKRSCSHTSSDAKHGSQALNLRKPTVKMAAVHGFIAGFGVGAFALIIYTILAPAMPNPYLAWLPGFIFGLGTMTMQVMLGAAFGYITQRLQLSQDAISRISGITAGRTLLGGGGLFILLGMIGLFMPSLIEWQITTPIYIHNLHHLGVAFLLVIIVVMGIGLGTLCLETRRARRKLPRELPNTM
jgi:hypothetical protein